MGTTYPLGWTWDSCGLLWVVAVPILPSDLKPRRLDESREAIRGRRSFATHLIKDGYDVRTTHEFLGHKDVTSSQVYTHVPNHGPGGVNTPAYRRVERLHYPNRACRSRRSPKNAALPVTAFAESPKHRKSRSPSSWQHL
jgi:hypothetical protein